MALRPGGPLGDYVSQTEYATESIKEQAALPENQQTDKQQIAPDLAASAFSRDLQPESPKLSPEERMASYNESITDRNNTERAEKLGTGPQQEAKAEQADEKKNVYQELAEKVAEQQKQESPALDQSRQQQPELGD